MARRVFFIDECFVKQKLHNFDGEFVMDLELGCIKKDGSVKLYICQDGDEQFENDSLSTLIIDLEDMLMGACEWTSGDFEGNSKKAATIDMANYLEYLAKKIRLNGELMEEETN